MQNLCADSFSWDIGSLDNTMYESIQWSDDLRWISFGSWEWNLNIPSNTH